MTSIKAEKDPVLFKIKTIDVKITSSDSDGKKTSFTMKGGKTYDVIGFQEGVLYVTSEEYKEGVPQLIPWDMAVKI